MMKGVENIFKVGVEYGIQLALGNQQSPSNIDALIFSLLEIKTVISGNKKN